MKKFNMSRIMKRAWVLVKKFAITISQALKLSWKETKESIAMKIPALSIYNVSLTDEQATRNLTEKEVLYKEFKNCNSNFYSLPTKKGSYNPDKKSIIVYFPKYFEIAQAMIKEYNDMLRKVWEYDETEIEEEGFNMGNATEWLISMDNDTLEEKYALNCDNDDEQMVVNHLVEIAREYRSTK